MIDAESRCRNPEEKSHLEVLATDGSIVLKWIIRRRIEGCAMDSSGSE
jgi:hypothetical protein